MKKIKCSGPGCESRRRHHESDEPRGPQWVEVPDDFPEDKKAYCSIECASYDGALAKRKVEKWIGYHVLKPDQCSSYPCCPVPALGGWVDETIRWADFVRDFGHEAKPYLEAVREDATKRGIRITGEQHQNYPEGVPLFDDGTVLKLSYRAWGDLMAAIWAEHDGKGYTRTWTSTCDDESEGNGHEKREEAEIAKAMEKRRKKEKSRQKDKTKG